MGLTAHKRQRLEDEGFIDLFTDERDQWLAMAKSAYEYTSAFVEDANQEVRRDDLLQPLVAALQVNETLREFLGENTLRQKYWNDYFAELIVDELWEELGEDEEDTDDEEDSDDE